jgi:predicted nucleic acid-binding protein
LTIDANVAVALSAKEVDKYETAKRELWKYARDGYQFYAPGVIVAECLFVLCKKLNEGSLSSADHAAAVAEFSLFMSMVLPPPNGDGSLVNRAEEIRKSYGCSRSADGIYLALAEELAGNGTAELLTFDSGLVNQARHASGVAVRLLLPTPALP